MGLHFSLDEYQARVERVRAILQERGRAGLLVFAQESHFYLTGYDSSSYLFFQAALVTADGRSIVLLTCRPDLRQAEETSTITAYRPSWMDVPPMLYPGNPMLAEPGMILFLHAMLSDAEKGLAMSAGHTVLVTVDGREVLSQLPLDLPVV